MSKPQVFRPISNWLLAATAWLILGLLPIEPLLEGNWLQGLKSLSFATAAAALVWLVFARPKLQVYEDRVVVTNPLRRHTIGFGALEAVNTRYFLTIQVAGKLVKCWVAPTPSRYASRGVRAIDLKGLPLQAIPGANQGDDLSLRAGDSPKAHSGQAAAILRLALEQDRTRSNSQVSTSIGWLAPTLAAATALIYWLL